MNSRQEAQIFQGLSCSGDAAFPLLVEYLFVDKENAMAEIFPSLQVEDDDLLIMSNRTAIVVKTAQPFLD